MTAPKPVSSDRRLQRRFPIRLEVEYSLRRGNRVLDRGRGVTVDLSSGGILFESTRAVHPGIGIELLISWPMQLNGMANLKLWIRGTTVRAFGNRTAVRTSKYEFRTAGEALYLTASAAG